MLVHVEVQKARDPHFPQRLYVYNYPSRPSKPRPAPRKCGG
jgi:hypothetical protein